MKPAQGTKVVAEAENENATTTEERNPTQEADMTARVRYALLFIIALMLMVLTSVTLDTLRDTEANLMQAHATLAAQPW